MPLDAEAAARRWVDSWTRGWRAHDPASIAAAYADDAVFLSHPFREPRDGPDGAAAYAAEAFADEDASEFWSGEPVVDGDRAAVEYWAYIEGGSREHTLAGITILRFGADGRVVEHRDYWAMHEGRRERTWR